jgi:hypothetical protein
MSPSCDQHPARWASARDCRRQDGDQDRRGADYHSDHGGITQLGRIARRRTRRYRRRAAPPPRLPPDRDERQILRDAYKRGIRLYGFTDYQIEPGASRPGLVLGYAGLTPKPSMMAS